MSFVQLTKQTMTLPAIGSVEVSFSQSFCETSSSLVFPRPVKLKKRWFTEKNVTLQKKKKDFNLRSPPFISCDKLSAKSLAGPFCYFLFIYKRTAPLPLHMNKNQITLMYRDVIDFNFLLSLIPSSVANILWNYT